MKKLITVFTLAVFAVVLSTNDANAQRYDEAQYNYADASTGTVYQLYLKFSGYQVRVWMKSHSQTQWTEYNVVETNDKTITVSSGTYKYHLEIDENNPDVVVMYTADYSKSYRYLKQ